MLRQIPLSFNAPAVSPATKAASPTEAGVKNEAIGTNYDTRENLSVFALFHAGTFDSLTSEEKASSNNLMTNVDCGWDNVYNGWNPAKGTPGIHYYWPMAGLLTFQAYSPSAARQNASITHDWASGFTFSNFRVQPAGQQYDLLYSDLSKDCQRAYYSVSGNAYDDDDDNTGHIYNGVDLTFHHALSLIEIQAKSGLAEGSATHFWIRRIRLFNVFQQGTFSNGDWSGQALPTDDTDGNKHYVAFNDQNGFEISSSTVFTPVVRDGKSNTLILLPQALTNVQLEVTYGYGTSAVNWTSTIRTVYIPLFATGIHENWEKGKKYVYQLTLTASDQIPIYLDPIVQDSWNGSDEQHPNLTPDE